jgi:hypothetical protein
MPSLGYMRNQEVYPEETGNKIGFGSLSLLVLKSRKSWSAPIVIINTSDFSALFIYAHCIVS